MGGGGTQTEEHVGTSEVVPEVQTEVGPEVQTETAEPGLKYLEFLRVAIINGTAYAVRLYNYGKEHAGSFKPRVDSVEGTVRNVAGPFALKVEGKLPEMLQFADKKVDDTIQYLDIIIPQGVKDRSVKAFDVARDAARQAPEAARTVVGQVQEQGVSNTASNYYTKFQPIAESYGHQALQSLMSLPLAPQAAGAARIGAEKLNLILLSLRDSQLPLSAYVPLLPLNHFEKDEHAEQAQFQVK
ncbi:unnamed protein product [Calypogeia fissa]